jgi:hypothetical protein
MTAVAHADEWSNTQEFTNAQSASIKVVEPEGYTVTINGRTDTAPAVFSVDNANNYLAMTVKSPDGATWTKKIEVKEYKQSVVRIKHVKAAAPAPGDNKAKPMSYVGTVSNTTNNCATGRAAIKLEFIAGAEVAKSAVLESGARSNLELNVGAYRIRLYTSNGQAWEFKQTIDYNVDKDGWVYDWGCAAPKRQR